MWLKGLSDCNESDELTWTNLDWSIKSDFVGVFSFTEKQYYSKHFISTQSKDSATEKDYSPILRLEITQIFQKFATYCSFSSIESVLKAAYMHSW